MYRSNLLLKFALKHYENKHAWTYQRWKILYTYAFLPLQQAQNLFYGCLIPEGIFVILQDPPELDVPIEFFEVNSEDKSSVLLKDDEELIIKTIETF